MCFDKAHSSYLPFEVQYSQILIKCHGLSVLIAMQLFQPDSIEI